MLLEIYDIKPLEIFFDMIHDSSNIVELKLTSDMLSCNLLNKSHVAFYGVEYSKEFFDAYDVGNDETLLIFVDDFYKILSNAHKNDSLTLSSDESSLKCVFEHDDNRRVFELPLAEDFGESPAPPSIDYDGYFEVNLSDLKQPVVDLDKIVGTDRCKMFVSDYKFSIKSSNDTMTKYLQEIDIDDDVTGNVVVNNSYIRELLKLSKICNTVKFGVGDNIPLSWNIEYFNGLVKYYGLIAPIIEDN